MTTLPNGTWIQRRVETLCRSCLKTQEFPPGELTEDGTWEIRTCPGTKCGAPWKTEALYACGPGDATEPDAY
ncbi:hypothetical protein J5Y04_16745 [Kitasatospora sp. RG8]|uniref:hypothetical protein n=1 Tax=Kitasatospora sp. RG8 TaxID=2820815 RepID=UPI001ADF2FC3|nr:hypothetical protein [Kitasatospora sp. RG8]MBP0451176.1 hypothetical protein [Kitasatospora sp. RG8]